MSFDMGLYGLGVMGQNLALNVAEKGFKIAVCNRSPARVDSCEVKLTTFCFFRVVVVFA